MKYLSVQEMVAVEKAADRAGHSYAEMMEEAGKGLAEVIHQRYYAAGKTSILALVGSGNNGGDGLVALDYLMRWGWSGAAVLVRDRDRQDPLLKRFLERGGELFVADIPEKLTAPISKKIQEVDVLLDGVLGTGIKLPLREPLDQLLRMAKELILQAEIKPIVVAVDCPSGVDCDTGLVSPSCIAADLTVVMAAIKQGLLKFPAYNSVGELELVDIGLPGELPEWKEIKRRVIEKDWVRGVIPERPLDAHKGTFGTSLIIAGSLPYPGAATLAGLSAYRIGAGLVTMAVPEAIYCGVVENFPEATWVVMDDKGGAIRDSDLSSVRLALGRATTCLIGPGLGLAECTFRFLEEFIRQENLPPLVIDADGLRLLSNIKGWPERLPAGTVLTPHPGEMAALCGLSIEEVQAQRVGIAEKFAGEWGQIVLLKGAHTVIAKPGGETRILIGADPSLARAGSGDVLSGILCGLIAQGVDSFEAAAAGSWLHARSGRLAAELTGSPAAVLAGDISEMIGQTLAEFG